MSLTNIEFEVYPNEIIVIVGTNGTGKTTLLSILTSQVSP